MALTTIQSVATSKHPSFMRGSDGTLYSVYDRTSGGLHYIAVGYSTDSGANFTEASTQVQTDYIVAAIDSSNIIHIIYKKTGDDTNIYQRTYTVSGGITAETSVIAAPTGDIFDYTNNLNNQQPGIAIDSSDNIHLALPTIESGGSPTHAGLQYTKYTTSWSALLQLDTTASGLVHFTAPYFAIDSLGIIHLVYAEVLTNAGGLVLVSENQHIKYTTSWSGITLLVSQVGINYGRFSHTVCACDNINNLHILWDGQYSGHTSFNNILYVKYTKSTDSFSSAVVAATEDKNYTEPTMVIDASNVINVFAESGDSIYLIQNDGSGWTTTSVLATGGGVTYSLPKANGTFFPIIGGFRVNRVIDGYYFTVIHTQGGNGTLKFFTTSDLLFDGGSVGAAGNGGGIGVGSGKYNAGTDGQIRCAPTLGNTINGVLDFTGISAFDKKYRFQDISEGYVVLQFPSSLTAGRIPFTNVNGLLIDDSDLSFDTNRLTATNITTTSLTDSGLTAGRVVLASTGGLLADDSDLTFSDSRLTATDLTVTNAPIVSSLTAGRVVFAGASKELVDDSDLTFSGSRLTATDLTVTNAPIVSSLTATRVVFVGASKELVDDADMTFVTDTFSVAKIVTRFIPRVVSMADATSFTPTGDTADINTQANTQAAGTLTANAPSGTPTDGQKLELVIKSTNAQTFSWNSIYAGCTTTPLPTATTGTTKTDKFFFQYNTVSSKWEIFNAQYGY